MWFLEHEVNDFHREDWYMAQLAATITRQNVKDPQSVKVSDFLLTFESKPTSKPKTQKAAIAHTKSTWAAIVGLKPKEVGL